MAAEGLTVPSQAQVCTFKPDLSVLSHARDTSGAPVPSCVMFWMRFGDLSMEFMLPNKGCGGERSRDFIWWQGIEFLSHQVSTAV